MENKIFCNHRDKKATKEALNKIDALLKRGYIIKREYISPSCNYSIYTLTK